MDKPGGTQELIRLPRWLQGVLLAITLITLWIVSVFLVSFSSPFSYFGKPDLSNLMTLLFGASSISLFLFSLFFAFFALVSWQTIKEKLDLVSTLEAKVQRDLTNLEKDTRDRIEKWSNVIDNFEKDRIKPLEREMTARVHSILGYALGELSTTPSFEIQDIENLRDAIDQCQTAFEYVRESSRDKPVEYMVLNNLLFYLSFIDDPSRKGFILEESRRLLRKAQAHDSINLMLTACRALLKFSSDKTEMKDAYDIIRAISSNPKVNERQKKEASYYLASFPEPKL